MTTEAKPVQLYHRVRDFILEIQSEMLKVTWPTKEDLNISTRVVVILLVVMSIFTYFADRIFSLVVWGLLTLGSK